MELNVCKARNGRKQIFMEPKQTNEEAAEKKSNENGLDICLLETALKYLFIQFYSSLQHITMLWFLFFFGVLQNVLVNNVYRRILRIY